MNTKTKMVKIGDIKTDPVGDSLCKSENTRPYIDVYVAQNRQQGLEEALQRVADLPLEKRYLWRVASALQRAFADFDSVSAKIDWDLMGEDQRKQISDLMEHRLWQHMTLLETLYGKSREAA